MMKNLYSSSIDPLPSSARKHDLYHAAVLETIESLEFLKSIVSIELQDCLLLAYYACGHLEIQADQGISLGKILREFVTLEWGSRFMPSWTELKQLITSFTITVSHVSSEHYDNVKEKAEDFKEHQKQHSWCLIAEIKALQDSIKQLQSSVEDTKQEYDRNCSKLTHFVGTLTNPDASDGANTDGKVPAEAVGLVRSSASVVSEMKCLQIPASEGALSLKSIIKTASKKQQQELEKFIQSVLIAEKNYLQSVEFFNSELSTCKFGFQRKINSLQNLKEEKKRFLENVFLQCNQELLEQIIQTKTQVANINNHLLKESREGLHYSIDTDSDLDTMQSPTHTNSYGSRKNEKENDNNLEQLEDEHSLDSSTNAFFWSIEQAQQLSVQSRSQLELLLNTLRQCNAVNVRSNKRLDNVAESISNLTCGVYDLPTDIVDAIRSYSSKSDSPRGPKDFYHSSLKGFVLSFIRRCKEIRTEFRLTLSESIIWDLFNSKYDYCNEAQSLEAALDEIRREISQDIGQYKTLRERRASTTRDFLPVLKSSLNMQDFDLSPSPSASDITKVLEYFLNRERKMNLADEKRTEKELCSLAGDVALLQQQVLATKKNFITKEQSTSHEITRLTRKAHSNEEHCYQIVTCIQMSFVIAYEGFLDKEIFVLTKFLDNVKKFVSEKITEEITVPRSLDRRIVASLCDHAIIQVCTSGYRQGHDSLEVKLREAKPILRDGNATGSGAVAIQNLPHTNSHARKQSLETETYSDNVSRNTDYELKGIAALDFQKRFHLSAPEQVLDSYSCALYLGNFPCHGRMYLTKDHICFSGWRDAHYVISYLDIKSLEKKNTAIIVPNAIEIFTKNDQKAFFASFVFRDECYNHIQLLYTITTGTAAVMAEGNTPSSGSREMQDQMLLDKEIRNSSSDVSSNAQTLLETRDAGPLEPDALMDEYKTILERKLLVSLEFVHSTLWVKESDFYNRALIEANESSINIGEWKHGNHPYLAPFRDSHAEPEIFQATRTVTYLHNKKYIIGPSSIPTIQIHRAQWVPDKRLVLSITSNVESVPYHDYFQVEKRWVYDALPNNVTFMRVGVRVYWYKSTWLKKQIEASVLSEAKDFVTFWAHSAEGEAKAGTRASINQTCAQTEQISPRKMDSQPIKDEHAKQDAKQEALMTKSMPDGSKTLSQRIFRIVGALIFIYMMYLLHSTVNELKLTTNEILKHNRQQLRLLEEILILLKGESVST